MKKYSLFALLAVISLMIISCGKEKENVTPKYSIAFDLHGKGTSIDTIYVEEGARIEEPAVPVDEYYMFDGWYKEVACVNPWDFETDIVTGNVTLYAKWETKERCVVLFKSNLAGIASIRDTVDYGSLVERPADMESEDYYFEGWYKNSSCTQKWDFDNDRVLQKTTRIYAKWSSKYNLYGSEIYTRETFMYGRFEARMKMAYTPGSVSSMFIYYNNSDIAGSKLWNEIDIEIVGKDSLKFQSNIITGNRDAKITSEERHSLSPVAAFNTDYHTFMIDWTPDSVVWYVDGVKMRCTKTNEAGTDQVTALTQRQSLRFNLWASEVEEWVGVLKPSKLPVSQYIDYVKVYSYDTEKQEFSEEPLWIDDFESFNSTRWSKGDWPIGMVRLKPANVDVKDGKLVLNLTKEIISR